MMKNLYEDKALGGTRQRFDSMIGGYEDEQKALIEKSNSVRDVIAYSEEATENAAKFVE